MRPLCRAVRVVRVLSLVSSASACGAADERIHPTEALADAHADADAGVTLQDAPFDTDESAADALAADGDVALEAEGPTSGRCFTIDEGVLDCGPGKVCTFLDSKVHCVDGLVGPGVQPCGLIACDMDSTCNCASSSRSLCACNLAGVGPLPPPDLPDLPDDLATGITERARRAAPPPRLCG